MLGFVKMSALSAVLSFVLVTAYNHGTSSAAVPPAGKLFQDRIAPDSDAVSTATIGFAGLTAATAFQDVSAESKGDRLPSTTAVPAGGDCARQPWPYVALNCMSRDDGRPKPGRVRVITVETRDGPNTSVLQWSPQTEIARR
jgi:hypothetical protein